MKKLFLTIPIIFICFCFQAQIVKGTKAAGVNLGFGNTRFENVQGFNVQKNKSTSFQFEPSYQFFTRDNFAIGGSLKIGLAKGIYQSLNYVNGNPNYQTSKQISTENNYGASINATHYKKIMDNFYYSTQFQLSYNYSSQKDKYSNGNTNIYINHNSTINNSIFASISPGVTYFVTPKFGLNLKTTLFSLGYQNNVTNYGSLFGNIYSSKSSSHNSFSHSLSLNTLSIGFNYFF